MIPILSSEKSVETDFYIINQLKATNGLLMMENAAAEIANVIKKNLTKDSEVLILCGAGNNGGDGFALARRLESYYNCTIYFIGNEDKMSNETKLNLNFAKKVVKNIINIVDEKQINNLKFDFHCIVDALIGTGGDENLRGIIPSILNRANSENVYKVAVDIPTGLNGTTGKYHENVFRANDTITMLATKRAFIYKDNAQITGEIHVADLGISQDILFDRFTEMKIESKDVFKALPKRENISNKNDYGKIAIIAGSIKYPGAAAIAANSAISSGAGLVHLYSNVFHKSLKPEIICNVLSSNSNNCISSNEYSRLTEELENFDVVLIGPGIGNSDDTLKLVDNLLKSIDGRTKIILDADAIRVLDKDSKLNKSTVITPHLGEFSRILGVDYRTIKDTATDLAADYANRSGANVLLKGSVTASYSPDGLVYYSTSGNPGLASGGTGDALSGIIASLAAMNENMAFASAFAAFWHGCAADLYIENHSEESLTATEIIENLGKAIKLMKQSTNE